MGDQSRRGAHIMKQEAERARLREPHSAELTEQPSTSQGPPQSPVPLTDVSPEAVPLPTSPLSPTQGTPENVPLPASPLSPVHATSQPLVGTSEQARASEEGEEQLDIPVRELKGDELVDTIRALGGGFKPVVDIWFDISLIKEFLNPLDFRKEVGELYDIFEHSSARPNPVPPPATRRHIGFLIQRRIANGWNRFLAFFRRT